MVILNRKNSFKRCFKASRYKKSNENQIQFGEITQYAPNHIRCCKKRGKIAQGVMIKQGGSGIPLETASDQKRN